MNKIIESAIINILMNKACEASSLSEMDAVIGRCLRSKLSQANTLGRMLIKDLRGLS